jgi:hypothetical protein
VKQKIREGKSVYCDCPIVLADARYVISHSLDCLGLKLTKELFSLGEGLSPDPPESSEPKQPARRDRGRR